jgi:hypothetical protein
LGKVWAYYLINSHDPRMIFHLTEFFEDKPCGFTIQVNFFTFVAYPKKF